MVSYARARAEALIPSCKVGFLERPERVVLIIIGALFNRMEAVLWVIAFTAAPGFFQPLEQEMARAIAARRARHTGSAPVIQRGALTGGMIASGLVVVIIIAALVSPLVDSLFKGQTLLVGALVIMLVGYFAEHMTRGVLAGYDRFGPYGLLVGSEGLLRLAACVVLAVIGVETAGPYGLLVAIAPFAAVAIALRDPRSRWGSASRQGRVMLSWRLVLAPPEALETVVVHELAHLRVFGHGPRFWSLVASRRPDHLVWRRWLRTHSLELHGALMPPTTMEVDASAG